MKPICYVCVGLPGSGKSTWANAQGLPVVSTDAIRKELFGDESIQRNPQAVFGIAFKKLQEQLKKGNSVIFDATNLTIKNRKNIFKKIYPFSAHAIVFPISANECIERIKTRERKVPSKVILNMQKHFQLPSKEEGFEEIVILQKKLDY